MREIADANRLERFMDALGAAVRSHGRVYLTGGATAVLMGWRAETVDVDIKLVPDSDEVLRAIPRLKEELALNVEPRKRRVVRLLHGAGKSESMSV